MNYLVGTQTPPAVETPIQETIDGITYNAVVNYQLGNPSNIIANVAY